MKDKGERVECRTAERDKKTCLSEQRKEIEENNRMGKNISLQENWRYQGNISFKDGHNKGQKWQVPNRSRKDYEEVAGIHGTVFKKVLMTWTTMITPRWCDHSLRARHSEV